MTRRTALFATALVLLAGAADARAGTLKRTGSTVTFTASPGEENRPYLGASDLEVAMSDAYTVDAGPGCSADTTGAASCPRSGVTRFVVRLGDEDDVIKTGADGAIYFPQTGIKLDIDGGPGDDEVSGSGNADELSGGAGRDLVVGGGGRDRIFGNDGKDRLSGFGFLSGGDGNDLIQTFDSRWKSHPSRIKAGAGNDKVLVGNREHDSVDCGAGRDRGTTTDYPDTAKRYGFKPDTFKRCER